MERLTVVSFNRVSDPINPSLNFHISPVLRTSHTFTFTISAALFSKLHFYNLATLPYRSFKCITMYKMKGKPWLSSYWGTTNTRLLELVVMANCVQYICKYYCPWGAALVGVTCSLGTYRLMLLYWYMSGGFLRGLYIMETGKEAGKKVTFFIKQNYIARFSQIIFVSWKL